MKKYLILSILSIIFTIASLPAGAVKTINANPVNLAAVIVEMVDSARIENEFAYYGYTLDSTEDGFKVMRSPNGHELRYSLNDSKAIDGRPVVLVKTIENPAQIASRLNELQFEKHGDSYRRVSRRDEDHLIQCTPNSSHTLLFQCLKR